jgi:hypothetical protein
MIFGGPVSAGRRPMREARNYRRISCTEGLRKRPSGTVFRACLLVLALWAADGNLRSAEPGRWAILLSGISGDPELQKQFLKEVRDLRALLEGTMQFQHDHVITLFDDPALDPSAIQFKATRENFEKACREIASKAGKSDLVFAYVTGHGSYDQNTYKLNLVGPDPTAAEFAEALYSIPAERFVVVNTTNSSGGSLPALSGEGKTVVTATKSGMERNQTHFSGYFLEALAGSDADKDKNGRISILEAFAYAAQKVEEYYSKEGELQTEHPVLDDNGDGEGHDKPGPDNGDGILARTTYLDTGAPLISKGVTAEERELAREAQSLEKQIEELKYRKAKMPESEYEQQLEKLLLRLAQVNEKLRKK